MTHRHPKTVPSTFATKKCGPFWVAYGASYIAVGGGAPVIQGVTKIRRRLKRGALIEKQCRRGPIRSPLLSCIKIRVFSTLTHVSTANRGGGALALEWKGHPCESS